MEWVIGGVVPFVLLVVPRYRQRFGLVAVASVLVMVGVYAFRMELVVGGMLKPLLHFAPGNALGTYHSGHSVFQFDGLYSPTWVEYAIIFALFAFLALVISLGYRWLRTRGPEAAAA
jgi:Ni/Fe-hydrogenase subunit HybB-like protein